MIKLGRITAFKLLIVTVAMVKMTSASATESSTAEKNQYPAVKDLGVVQNSNSETVTGKFIESVPSRAPNEVTNSRQEVLQEKKVATGTYTATKPKRADTHKPGHTFRDCDICPEMVVIPAGEFTMGSPANEEERYNDESPQHKVRIAKPLAVGKFEVTFDEWDACVADDGCENYSPDDRDWGRGRRPVIDISWPDANMYIEWLSQKTGKNYRLLSEAEWEYAARVGTETPFHTGKTVTTNEANYNGEFTYGSSEEGEYRAKTVEVGSFQPNAFGLHDMHGNVWEWVEDCWNDNYHRAPTNGLAWTKGACSLRIIRGGSWKDKPWDLRSAVRGGEFAVYSDFSFGFRVARTID